MPRMSPYRPLLLLVAVELALAHPDEEDWDPLTAQRTFLSTGDFFRVLPGNMYRLQNYSRSDPAVIYWTIMRPEAAAAGEDATAANIPKPGSCETGASGDLGTAAVMPRQMGRELINRNRLDVDNHQRHYYSIFNSSCNEHCNK